MIKNLDDPYLWLENIKSKEALNWARLRTHESSTHLEGKASFQPMYENILNIYNDDHQIPFVSQINGYFYNFKKETASTRGQWLRTTLEEYRKSTPTWQLILDLDALSSIENENWVWVGATPLLPEGRFCLIGLSYGGTDVKVIREFDITTGKFVDNGFNLPPAKGLIMDGFNDISSKGGAGWINANTIYIYTDFGSSSLTTSGYPRILKQWHRGTSLKEAEILLECDPEDIMVCAWTDYSIGNVRHWAARYIDFFHYELFLRQPNGQYTKVDKPLDAHIKSWRDDLFLLLQSDWFIAERFYPKGSLLVINFNAYMQGNRNFEILFSPDSETSLNSVIFTANNILVSLLKNVKSLLINYTWINGKWSSKLIPLPQINIDHIAAVDTVHSDDYLITYSDFLKPTTYALGNNDSLEILKTNPSYFEATNLITEQYIATSSDKTQVPYFVVRQKNFNFNGQHPTLLYGYGGFQCSITPKYDPMVGKNWLNEGGIFVVANIRGGGEFGPAWHQAAKKNNRQCAYDDFIAVAEDLIARKITSPKHLGIMGASNGGLLVSAVMIQRPELFNAVVCQVPLLDMYRYHLLLAGASWIDEYGNPDNLTDWQYLSLYSPYQNVKSDQVYPACLFETATSDDRVHPGHARKMVAKMKEQGHQKIFYLENEDGGHGAKMNNQQRAKTEALIWVFLRESLF